MPPTLPLRTLRRQKPAAVTDFSKALQGSTGEKKKQTKKEAAAIHASDPQARKVNKRNLSFLLFLFSAGLLQKVVYVRFFRRETRKGPSLKKKKRKRTETENVFKLYPMDAPGGAVFFLSLSLSLSETLSSSVPPIRGSPRRGESPSDGLRLARLPRFPNDRLLPEERKERMKRKERSTEEETAGWRTSLGGPKASQPASQPASPASLPLQLCRQADIVNCVARCGILSPLEFSKARTREMNETPGPCAVLCLGRAQCLA